MKKFASLCLGIMVATGAMAQTRPACPFRPTSPLCKPPVQESAPAEVRPPLRPVA